MKKALVHDWYYVNGGAEKVVKSINEIWKDFDHYALVDFLTKKDRETILSKQKVKTSFVQNLPTARNDHRKFLQLFPLAMEQFDLSDYDLVISSSASIAKGVLTNSNQLHICYCHSPMRYAWDLYYQYAAAIEKNRIKSLYAKRVLHKMRIWDVVSSNRVDYFVANSIYIARRIKKIYNREATVIYPPVDVDTFSLETDKSDFYFTASRMVSYKRIDLIVKAFNLMPERQLKIAGSGPELRRLKKIAGSNIKFLGFLEKDKLAKHMQDAKAFIFASEEDFGIVPVEAQACGTPVIAFNRGGVKETVIPNRTGLLFDKQEEKSIISAILEFEKLTFNPHQIRQNALKFSKERFQEEFKNFVRSAYQKHLESL